MLFQLIASLMSCFKVCVCVCVCKLQLCIVDAVVCGSDCFYLPIQKDTLPLVWGILASPLLLGIVATPIATPLLHLN